MSLLLLAILLKTAAEVAAVPNDQPCNEEGAPLVLSGSVDAICSAGYVLRDTTGAVIFRTEPTLHGEIPVPGDLVCVSGHVQISRMGEKIAKIDAIRKIGHKTLPKPKEATPRGVIEGRFNHRRIRLRGVVTEAFRDEIDPKWNWLYLTAEDAGTVVSFQDPAMTQSSLDALLDATVEVTGIALPGFSGYRMHPGSRIETPSLGSIRVIDPPNADPFSAVDYKGFTQTPPKVPPLFRHRQKVIGRILATWRGDSLLLITPERHRLRVKVRRSTSLPPVGATITAVGFVRRNAFFTFMTEASLRLEPKIDVEPDPSETLDLDDVLIGNNGLSAYPFGRPVLVTGSVRSVSSANTPLGRLMLDVSGHHVGVEIGMADPPDLGSVVAVKGICLMYAESDDWDIGFGRLRDFVLVPQSPQDVVVVKSAPWWTTGRLMVVIGSLLGALVAILLWNVLLRRLAERQGKELFKSQIASVTSLLRIDERTRLAVELHDALSQQLTAVAYEIAAAESVRATEPDTSAGHLSVASRMLQSCRTELRRCLWDLRSEALDEKDFAEAIRRTVMPVIGEAELSIRFNVSRARIGDLTAHAVLCIIRELTANAVRHGKALHIYIAGERKDNGLRFSVRDDGCGFDPATAPGSPAGHFGLTGIRDRINRQGGTFDLDSRRGAGTRVVVSLP